MKIVEDYLDNPEWVEARDEGLRGTVYEVPDELWGRYLDALAALRRVDQEITAAIEGAAFRGHPLGGRGAPPYAAAGGRVTKNRAAQG